MFRPLSIAFSISLMTGLDPAMAQAPAAAQAPATAPRPPRPAPPTRDPHTPGYVTAKELPDGAKFWSKPWAPLDVIREAEKMTIAWSHVGEA